MFKKGNSANLSHGHSRRGKRSAEYACWLDIKRRCLNPSFKHFEYYGGRGIKICARWANSFENFLADVGKRPSPRHSIDRYPNNNGDYKPGNVRWATRQEQIDNRRNTPHVKFRGRKAPISFVCRELGLNRNTVFMRISRGWKPEDAITPPLWKR
jgi:hypothetical protein